MTIVFCAPCSGKTALEKKYPEYYKAVSSRRIHELSDTKINLMNPRGIKFLVPAIKNPDNKIFCILPGSSIYTEYQERARLRAVASPKKLKDYKCIKDCVDKDFEEYRTRCNLLHIPIIYLDRMDYDLHEIIQSQIKKDSE